MAWRFFTALGAEKQSSGSITDRGTNLPASPFDGQEYSLVVDATNGVVWRFKYNAGSGSSFKWEFVGGSPMVGTVDTPEAANFVGTWGDLATVGATVTLPRAGDYLLQARSLVTCGAGADVLYIGLAVGATSPPDATYQAGTTLVGGGNGHLLVVKSLTGVAANTTYRMRYFGGNQSNTWQARKLWAIPIRVS